MEWGNWKLNPETRQLEYNDGDSNTYEINVDDMNSSAPTLDWIYQLHGKTWMTPRGMYDLLTAIDDIFMVQGSFCSGGQDHRVDARALVTRYIAEPNYMTRLFGADDQPE